MRAFPNGTGFQRLRHSLILAICLLSGIRMHAQCGITAPSPTIASAGCGLSNGSIRPNLVGVSGTVSYSWAPTGRTAVNLLNVPAGTYVLTVRRTSAPTCTQTLTFVVPLAPDVTPPTIQCNPTAIYDNTPGVCGAVLQIEAALPIDFRMATGGITTLDPAPTRTGGSRNAGNVRNATARFNPGGLMLGDNTIYTPVASDLCGAVRLSVSRSDGKSMTDVFPIGNTTLTWVAKDGSNNTSSCAQIITVRDVEKPRIFLPANLNLVTIPTGCGANVSWTEPSATDNCAVASLGMTSTQYTNGGFFTSGVHTITYRAVDTNGNSIDTSFIVTVADRVIPTIVSCPQPVTVVSQNGCNAVVALNPPTATDNCTPDQQLIISNDAPSVFPVGVTTVTWKIADASGNFNTCTQNVTVLDQTNPVPAVASLPDVVGECSVTVAPPVGTDCGRVLTASTSDPTTYNTLGSYVITWTLRDSSGNSITQTQNVTVRDVTPPVVTCPGTITVTADRTCGAFVTITNQPASDNCQLRSLAGVRSDNKQLTDCFPVGTTTIRWTATDWAGNTSYCDQTIIVSDISIRGTVYNDVNALKDGLINGTPISNAGGPLYVNLVDAATNTVVASKMLTDGTFSFSSADGLSPNVSSYKLVLAGSASATNASLPDAGNWLNTGEGNSGSAGDGAVNGEFWFTGAVTNGQAIDFGIEARPVPNPFAQAPARVNPGGTDLVTIAPTLFSAADATDLNGAGEVRYLHILSFPTSTTTVNFASAATSLNGTYGAVSYTGADFPAGGVYVATNLAGNPTAAISVDPVDGAVDVDFTYTAIDQADVESNTTGIARQPLTELSISGTIYNDVNALKDGLINGTPISNAGGQLYVNLVDAASNTVVAFRTPVNGTFSFGTSDGLRTSVTTYKLVLANSATATNPVIPNANAWLFTGEGNSGSSGDGAVDGSFTFGGAVTNGQAIDFGVEARPVPATLNVAPAQVNPGGTNLVTIAPTLFSATDARDLNAAGEVRFLHLVSFPTNTTTVNFASAATTLNGAYGAVSYTPATFPAGGVYIACNLAGNPTAAITVDPIDGPVDIDFTYKAIDQADVESIRSGIARQPLREVAISGHVYDDADGATNGVIDGVLLSNAGGQLYVNLVDAASNTVIASKAVVNGAFSFNSYEGLRDDVTTYKLVLTNTAAATGALLPDAANWLHTGEGNSGSAGDAAVDGSFTFSGVVTNGQVIDFGIEARPVPNLFAQDPPVVNPGGTNYIPISPALFAATDAADLNGTGVVKYIHILSFPTNTTTVKFAGASTTLGGTPTALAYTASSFPAGGVYLATNAAGNPVTAISVDPVDGIGNIDFTYKAVDQANAESNDNGVARQPLLDIVITGTVYNDANALTDALINGTPISNAGGQLYVNLVNGADNTVVASKSLADGSFRFSTADGLRAGVSTYRLVLSASAAGTGADLPDATNWVFTGEGKSGTAGDGSVNGSFSFGAPVTDGQAIDLGIEARPVPTPLTTGVPQTNPGGTVLAPLASTLFSATDATDLNGTGIVKYIRITGFPTNTTSISFAGASTTLGGTPTALSYTAASFPAGGVYLATNASGNPLSAVSIDPVDGSVTADIPYKAIDQANVESNATGIARQPFTDLYISGSVYDDANALTDGLINGVKISNAGGSLYVNLVNTANNTVVASKPVVNGTFNFTTADGLSGSVNTYKLVLTGSASATGAQLPDATSWVFTGEGNSGGSGDGTVNGSFTFNGVVTNGQAIDFGIEARPVPAALTVAPSQLNPGGTNLVTIAPTLFSANDATDLNATGQVRYLHLLSFPTNTTTVNFASAATTLNGAYGAVSYTSATFPAGGVYIACNLAGNPTAAITVDPVDGAVNVDFNYTAIDQANVESLNSGIARQPLREILISGKVYDDADGSTDGVIDGVLISNAGGQLYVNLVNTATNALVASKPVTNGVFEFGAADGLRDDVATYRLVLTNSASAIAPILPDATNWVYTGEGNSGTAGDATVNGCFNFGGNVTNGQAIDFGLEARPVPNNFAQAPAVANPGGTNAVTIPATLFSATDAADLNNTGVVKFIWITAFPTNTTTVFFAGASTTLGGTPAALSYTAATFPAGGLYVATNAAGNPLTAISADPIDGPVNIDFSYKAVDQANVVSNATGLARQPLFCPAPVITCPANITVNNQNNRCGAMVTVGTPTTTGSCAIVSVAGTRSDNQLLNALYPVGTTTITWRATDESGNVSTCTQTITVNDNQRPAITCAANVTVNTTAGACSAGVTLTQPTATDNCGVASIAGVRSDNQPLSAVYPKGVTTIIWTATDVNGNTATCTQTVTVTDNEKPVINCAVDIIAKNTPGVCGAVLTVAVPVATDNCAASVSVTGTRSDNAAMSATFPVGTTTITWTANDGNGNTSTCTQRVTVSDSQAPSLTCGNNVSVPTDVNRCTANYNVSAPSASDNCGVSSVTGVRSDNAAMNAAFPVGTTTITWTATDVNGLTATCTQTVTVNDVTRPSMTCPANLAAVSSSSSCGATITVATPSASDNCSGVTVTGVRSDALALTAAYPVGNTIITWTARDASGNTTVCSQTVTVTDNTKPTLTVPAPITQCDDGAGNNLTRVATATDNCSVASVTFTLTGATTGSGTGLTVTRGFNVGVTTITWTVADASGNSITGSTTVTVNPLPGASISLTSRDTLCNTTVITGSGGTSYQWYNGNGVVGTSAALTLPLANCTGTQPFAPTAAAQGFNVFVQGGVTASAGDTHGPVAMGGNLTLSGQTIFTMNTNGSYPSGTLNGANNLGMVIGGRVLFNSGNQSTVNQGFLRIGDATGSQIWYTDNNNNATNLKLTASGAGFNGNPSLMLQRVQANGTATQASGLNFGNAFSTFSSFNSTISGWANASDPNVNKITIPAGSNPQITLAAGKINYINLTAAQLNNLVNQGSVIFTNKPTANTSVVFNVTLSGNFSWTPANLGGLAESDAAYILWNFTGTGNLSIDGSNPVYGTIYAPSSGIVKNNPNNLNGQVIGQSLQVGPGEIHYWPFSSGLSYQACGNTYSLVVTDANGCRSTNSASYVLPAATNPDQYTIVGLDAVTLADNNDVQTGSVGVNNAGGTATVQGVSYIDGTGAFLKAPVLSVAGTSTVPTRITAQAGYVLPQMQTYTSGFTGLNNFTVNANATGSVAGNYGAVYVTKGANVTFSGTTFSSMTIEEGATVTFSATTLNLQNLTVGNGNNNGVATANFAAGAAVRISGQVRVGLKSVLNGNNNRVTFYLSGTGDVLTVSGRGATVNGVVYAPNGNIRVLTDIGVPVVTSATAANCSQGNGCITTTYQGWKQNTNGTYTLTFLIKNQCGNAVSNMAFSLPSGQAISWTKANSAQSYNPENGTSVPFYSLKLNTIGEGIKSGQTETITYTISAAQFNAMPTIQVAVKYATQTATASFNRDGCGTNYTPTTCTASYMNGLFIAKQVIADKCVFWNSLNCGQGARTPVNTPAAPVTVAPVQTGRMMTTIDADATAASVTAYPNPSRGNFQLQLRGFEEGPVTIQVIDGAGTIVSTRQLTLSAREQLVPVQMPAVANGLFTVRVSGRSRTMATRVMIQR